MNVSLFSLCVSARFFAKDFRIFCLEYPSRRSEKGNVYFANYRFSFRFVPFRFADYSKPVVCRLIGTTKYSANLKFN